MSDDLAKTPTPYDFKKPSQLPGNICRRMMSWQTGLCDAFLEKLGQYLAFTLTLQAGSVAAARPSIALEELPDTAVGYQITLASVDAKTLFVFPRQLMLALVGGMLGDSGDELPEDRPLTQVENSLGEMIAQELAAAMDDSWLGTGRMTARVAEIELKPKRTRIFTNDDSIVCAQFSITGPFGSESARWLLSEAAVDRVLMTSDISQPNANERNQLMQLVHDIPVKLVAKLGQTTMHANQLAGLRVGDVIIFDQRVSDPVTLIVEDQAKFVGWPGQIGSRQAIYIASEAD
jgi:flagellar motor switch protein FliM